MSFQKPCLRYLTKSRNLTYVLPKPCLRYLTKSRNLNYLVPHFNFVRVSDLPSGVSDLLSPRTDLLSRLWLRACSRLTVMCFRFTFAADFASEALTSCIFPSSWRTFHFAVLFERSLFANSRTLSRKQNNSARPISQKQNNSPQPKHCKTNFISRTSLIYISLWFDFDLRTVDRMFRNVLKLCWTALDLSLGVACLQFP